MKFMAYFNAWMPSWHASGRRGVLIFAQGRTGSTLLEDLLNSTGWFRSYGEVLAPEQRKVCFPRAFLKGLLRAHNKERAVAHVKIEHLYQRDLDPAWFLNGARALGWDLVYLRRKDTLLQALSLEVARARGRYHKYNDNEDAVRVRVDIDRFVNELERIEAHGRKELEALAGTEYLELCYEDDLRYAEQQQQTVDHILDSLDLGRRCARTKHKKVVENSIEDIVENDEALFEALERQGIRCGSPGMVAPGGRKQAEK